jgi:FkbM family methyltransferase
MVTLKEIFLSISTTKNFWDGLMLAYFKQKAHLRLRAGGECYVRWQEYQNILNLTFHGYVVTVKNGVFYCKRDNMTIVGSSKILPLLGGYLDMYKVFDYSNKVVLDIGGFMGETAVLFTKWGAKKIIIYEPVPENHEFIRKNVQLNGIDAEIHDEGIGETDSLETVAYDEIDRTFGAMKSGSKYKRIKIKSAEKIINESGANIAKMNCEGSEIALLSVSNEVLGKISNYVIETHSQNTRNSLLRKFASAGFKASERQLDPGRLSVIAFKKRL